MRGSNCVGCGEEDCSKQGTPGQRTTGDQSPSVFILHWKEVFHRNWNREYEMECTQRDRMTAMVAGYHQRNERQRWLSWKIFFLWTKVSFLWTKRLWRNSWMERRGRLGGGDGGTGEGRIRPFLSSSCWGRHPWSSLQQAWYDYMLAYLLSIRATFGSAARQTVWTDRVKLRWFEPLHSPRFHGLYSLSYKTSVAALFAHSWSCQAITYLSLTLAHFLFLSLLNI